MNPNFPDNLDIRPLSVDDVGSYPHVCDARFDTAAQQDAIGTYGIAGRVWEASYAVLSYLDRSDQGISGEDLEFDPRPFTMPHAQDVTNPLTIVELGSGTGLVAARVADHLVAGRDLVVATDLPEVCSLLERNLGVCPAVRVYPLPWGDYGAALALASNLRIPTSPTPSSGDYRCISHIICSDLIYFPELLAPLLRSLLHLTQPPFVHSTDEACSVIMSYKIRSLAKETPFWLAFGLWFSFSPVLCRQKPVREDAGEARWQRFISTANDDETFVLVAHRRRESWAWDVPEDDADLLRGVGAWGTSASKADDKFEVMLLMSMDASDVGMEG